jgi:NADH:ubiquinone oxidoreductase subunit 3 (subunit A)
MLLRELLFIILVILIIAGLIFFNHYEHDNTDITTTPYECGFIPFSQEYPRNNIKFFVHSILYLVFDLEILLLLPMVITNYYYTLVLWMVLVALVTMIIIGTYAEIREKMFGDIGNISILKGQRISAS